MAFFFVSTDIDAPPSRVWDLLSDWEGSAAWMVDATTVEVVGEQRTGVGTKVRAVTRIAGIALEDRLRVVGWEDEHLISIMHVGWPIRGLAWFEIFPRNGGTRFDWGEELDPPLGPLGELGGRILRRPIERVLAKSAMKLKALAEVPYDPGGASRYT